MKNKRFGKICSLVLAALMITAVPVNATGDGSPYIKKESPVSDYFNEKYINPEYEQWVKDGQQGTAPPIQDLSYLEKSYVNLPVPCAGIPEAYDLRDYGLVEPVYNQGAYDNCWAVAANVVAGSPLLEQFPQLSLSPYHTTWFTYRGNEEEEADYCDNPYAAGGFSTSAVATLAAWKGPVYMDSITTDPYAEGDPDECTRFKADFHMQDSYYMPSGTYNEAEYFGINKEITKKIIMETGPVSVKFKSDDDCFNSDTSAWYNKEEDYSDHQVVIVGWDDNYSRKNFLKGKRPEKNGAWLVRNSWGTDWGDDGYFWLSYEDKTTGISSAMVLEEKDNYKKNYQYDTLGWVYSIAPDRKGGETKSGTAANIFKAESNEILEAVSFFTTDAATEYKISVYTGVKKNSPESGKQIVTQEDFEPFAGYHTIELDEPVKLKKGENFSIVVTLKNPEFPCAIPVEMRSYYDGNPPEYMGNGGESYIISNGKWKDVAGYMDDFYITNVCIKGFTNPLPSDGEAVATVRTSEKAGPVKDGTELELTANGSDAVYYSLDGAEYSLYEDAIRLNLPEKDDKVTVSAYSVKDGAKSNVTEKTYTKAYAQLTDLAVSNGWRNDYLKTDTAEIKNVFCESFDDELSVMGQSGDKIYVNGKPVQSSEWSEPLKIKDGGMTVLTVTVKGEGKEDTVYRINAYRNLVKIDYLNETISFDDTKYRLEDPKGKVLKSGDSITKYADREYDTELTLTTETGGETIVIIPAREKIYDMPIDFVNETTLYPYDKEFRYSEYPDMRDSKSCNDKVINLQPGKDLYFQVNGSENNFISGIYHLVVPERPEGPEIRTESVSQDVIRLKKSKNIIYSSDGENWGNKTRFDHLKPDKEYTFYAYRKATDESFASEISTVKIKTMKQQVSKDLGKNEDPETGDTSMIGLWMMLLITSILFAIVLILLGREEKK